VGSIVKAAGAQGCSVEGENSAGMGVVCKSREYSVCVCNECMADMCVNGVSSDSVRLYIIYVGGLYLCRIECVVWESVYRV
jgi:hypothetical protein